MKMRAAIQEHIFYEPNSSVYVLFSQLSGPKCINYWHYHPEIELVYIDQGNASRHIGNHISRFSNGDLLLIGSGVPHRSFTEDLYGEYTEVVVQWKPDFLGDKFFNQPELQNINALLEKSQSGISFGQETRKEVAPLMLQIYNQQGMDRVLTLLTILHLLANSTAYELLHAGDYDLVYKTNDKERIDAILAFVKRNYAQKVDLQEVAAIACLTKQSFCRYFKQCTGLTFFDYLNRFRISRATDLICSSSFSVGQISQKCGFQNLSTFNKQFKRHTSLTPLSYRQKFSKVVSL